MLQPLSSPQTHEDDEPPRDPQSLTSVTPNPNPKFLGRAHPPPPPILRHVSFNHNYDGFAAGTDRGFRIFNCEPYTVIFRREFERFGSIRFVEMLFPTKELALVGGDDLNRVRFWKGQQNKCVNELSFQFEVCGVRLCRDRVVVVLEKDVFVYNLLDSSLLNRAETIANPKGLCEVSQNDDGSLVLACPGLLRGQIRVEHYQLKLTKFIAAHDSGIACFALTRDGQVLATASEKGTLVRIFSSQDGQLLQEVRRGWDRAEIFSLAFSTTSKWLAVSSNKGTVHVFSLNLKLKSTSPVPAVASSNSSLSFIRGLAGVVLPEYLSLERSVAQLHLQQEGYCQYKVAFGKEVNTVIILGSDGSFYRCRYEPVSGGEMSLLEYHNFLRADDDDDDGASE